MLALSSRKRGEDFFMFKNSGTLTEMTQQVSILLPTYEPNPAHLREAITSVQAQTTTEWSLLVHDDASTSDVEAIVTPFLADNRIRFVRGTERRRIGGNWNATLRAESALHAATPFVQYFFQDDRWEPTYLATALEAAREHPTGQLISLRHRYECEEGTQREAYGKLEAVLNEIPAGLHKGEDILGAWIARGLTPNIIGEPSFVLIRRSALTEAGPFLEDMHQLLDAEMWTRILQLGDWVYVPGEHGTFRVHQNAASERHQREGIGLFDRFRCLTILEHDAESAADRRAATQVLRNELSGMIRKFFSRRAGGKRISGQGKNAFIGFCLRHPLLLCEACIDALR
jgi:glycosyltransferase involved in cell wall biosynthesis